MNQITTFWVQTMTISRLDTPVKAMELTLDTLHGFYQENAHCQTSSREKSTRFCTEIKFQLSHFFLWTMKIAKNSFQFLSVLCATRQTIFWHFLSWLICENKGERSKVQIKIRITWITRNFCHFCTAVLKTFALLCALYQRQKLRKPDLNLKFTIW